MFFLVVEVQLDVFDICLENEVYTETELIIIDY